MRQARTNATLTLLGPIEIDRTDTKPNPHDDTTALERSVFAFRSTSSSISSPRFFLLRDDGIEVVAYCFLFFLFLDRFALLSAI